MKRWWKATWCIIIVLTVVVTGQALTATAATKAVKPRVNRTVKAPTKHQYTLVMGHGAGDSGARQWHHGGNVFAAAFIASAEKVCQKSQT